MMSGSAPGELFDARYYATSCGAKYERNEEWLLFFDRIAERIMADIGPQVVMDAGCALGLLVEALRTRGVCAFGRDISSFAIGNVHPSVAAYCELGSITDPFPQRYDLIVTIEVLEHMPAKEAGGAIANLCKYTDDILFSSTPFDYKEATHFNVQPPEYWAELFAQQGFYRDVDYDASYITEWAVRFRRRSDPTHRIIRDYERGYWMLHKENRDLRHLVLETYRAFEGGQTASPALSNDMRPDSALVVLLDELGAELAGREADLTDLRSRLRALEESPGYAILRRLQRLRSLVAPPSSSREHILVSLLEIARRHNMPTVHAQGGRIRHEMRQQMGLVRRRVRNLSYRRPGPTLPVSEAPTPPDVVRHVDQVDVVICIHNALQDVRCCLEAVEQHSSSPHRLIIVNDGSDAETTEYLNEVANRTGAFLIRNEQALGYTYAANRGLRTTTAEFVILLNSDTIVGPGWLDRLVACAAGDPGIGLVGPLSNFATWQSVPHVIEYGQWANNPLPGGFAVADMAEAIGRFSARLHPRVPFLNGFCLLIRRSVIDSVGVFDEENFGLGYGEENDYCFRARAAGWSLAIADDAYVYHSGSRSYTDQRRHTLIERSDETLKRKYGAENVQKGAALLANDRVLHGIRAHAAVAPEQETLMRLARQKYAGRKLLWLLPVMFSGGGGAVVAAKARIMRDMGVDVAIFNLYEYREAFERNYPAIGVPVIYGQAHDVAEVGPLYDAVVATANASAVWLLPLAAQAPQTRLGYFIQDFEPYFYDTDTLGYKLAWASYSMVPNLRRFATTAWIRDEVVRNTGMDCGLVGGCYNAALFRARPRALPEWPERPLRVAAMIRPGSQYRAPRLTMEVLSAVARRFKGKVEIRLFGVDASNQSFLELPHDFPWSMAGAINQRQMAMFLNDVDIFVDFSTFQALGITAQEAMSCGAAVIVPEAGGAGTFARHGHNCLVVDTSSAEACTAALTRLLTDHDLRARLQRNGMYDVCAYHPELPTYNILKAMFE